MLLLLLPVTLRAGGASIHERVDELIAQKAAAQPPAPPASDTEFLRRAYLDFAGTIPTAAEARQFLADADPEKRTKLIDRLLSGPLYARRMQEAFGLWLMERRTGDGEPAAKWEQYLQASFAANKPWDRLAREILGPDPVDEATRASSLFFTKRLEAYGQNPVDYPGVARDIGRMFLGVDLKCAQCHNHKYIKDYTQADFQGLFAFVVNTAIRKDTGLPTVAEKPLTKKLEYVSVFRPNDKLQTGPRVPGGAEIEIPAFKEGEEYAQPPDESKKFPGVPKFSPLKVLGEQLPKADNAAFKRNIANRLWFHLMGRGIVHPPDMHHAQNPPSHPELLDYLTEQTAATGFDVKAMLRQLALSQTYQRSGLLPEGQPETRPESYLAANSRRLSAEQLMWSFLTATGELDAATAASAQKSSSQPPSADGAGKAPVDPAAAPPHRTLEDYRKKFLGAFANPAGEPELEFAPSVAAALFVSNDGVILDALKPRPGNLIDRVSKLPDANAVAEELYLSILTRLPTEEERADVTAYLAKRDGQRNEALGELAWSLLASTEFCVNH